MRCVNIESVNVSSTSCCAAHCSADVWCVNVTPVDTLDRSRSQEGKCGILKNKTQESRCKQKLPSLLIAS